MTDSDLASQVKTRISEVLKRRPESSTHSSHGTYHPSSALGNAFTFGGQSAIVGVVAAGLRNSLAGRNAGFALPIGAFAAVGATYAFTEAVVANQREASDTTSVASGACAAGFLLGLGVRSIPVAVGTCSLMAAAAGLQKYTNGMNTRHSQDTEKSFFKPSAVVESIRRES
ncbi:hypothetical protein MIND_00480000 [Mycena indigotica]|uniref:NADH-ubiquinone oxidoreductase subunit B14.7 n=1 Tax=Mycena indigotica TaxID=2126181 RepID=A0A8H6SWU6_9AGAR|nr:uncharacterized protein MIND_00480000 [Mycena indigotica]KAF7306876.1 hypothetical protein MIND_00480000 [Mycena indigotica]